MMSSSPYGYGLDIEKGYCGCVLEALSFESSVFTIDQKSIIVRVSDSFVVSSEYPGGKGYLHTLCKNKLSVSEIIILYRYLFTASLKAARLRRYFEGMTDRTNNNSVNYCMYNTWTAHCGYVIGKVIIGLVMGGKGCGENFFPIVGILLDLDEGTLNNSKGGY